MNTEEEIYVPDQPTKRKKDGIWAKMGGGSLTVAIILHVILIALGAFWVFTTLHEVDKKVDFVPNGGGGEKGPQYDVQRKKQAQITPSSVKRVFAEGANSTFALPEQGDDFGEVSALSSLTSSGGLSGGGGLGGGGKGSGFGKGINLGSGVTGGVANGKLFGLIPSTLRKRCSKEDRLQRLQENGGNAACEEAVLKGLRWLKGNQNTDGSWGTIYQSGMTGLVLLAYFGHCETPASEEFGDSCLKGISYLVNLGLKRDGKLANNLEDHSWCYEHAIATYALAEANIFCKAINQPVPSLSDVVGKAGQFIIDHQVEDGGWSYNYFIDAATATGPHGLHVDTSVITWQIQALKACSHSGVSFSNMTSCINKALKFVNTFQAEDGGYGYAGPASRPEPTYATLTGAGMLCNQMWGKGSRPEVSKGAKYILQNSRFDYDGPCCDLYGHYYESQAMMQKGGQDWVKYNEMFRDQLLNSQQADGSWRAPGSGGKIRAVGGELFVSTPLYRNCLNTLMLEVYYRFLSTGGGKERDF
jgi:Prenyltransferase and squalene oxidase repeat